MILHAAVRLAFEMRRSQADQWEPALAPTGNIRYDLACRSDGHVIGEF